MTATALPTANTSRASRTTPWCAAMAVSRTTRGCRTRPMPPSCARRTPMPACWRSMPRRRARPSTCWRCSPPRISRRPALPASRAHPPVVGRGGAKMAMPFRPALAGDKVDACRRCRWRWWWRRRAAAAQDAAELVRGRLRGIAGGGRSRRRDEGQDAAFCRTRRAISASTGRARCRASRTNATSPRSSPRRRMWRASASSTSAWWWPRWKRAAPPASTTRTTTATRCTPARRAPTPCAARPPRSWACRTTSCG